VAELHEIIATQLLQDTGAGGVNNPDTGATGGFHRNKAPQNATYHRIVITDVTGLPIYTFTQEAARRKFIRFMVYAVDPLNSTETGTQVATRLNKRVQALFFDLDTTLGDSSLIYSRMEREISSDSEFDKAWNRDVYSEGCIMEFYTA